MIPFPTQNPQRERALTIAESLVSNQPDIGWNLIGPGIQTDPQFGHQLFEKFVNLYRHDKIPLFANRLNETQIADIYLWLTSQYPHNEDPQHEGAHAVSIRESIANFRDGLLEQLKIRGTEDACRQICRIIESLPKLS